MPYDPFVTDGTKLQVKISSTFSDIEGVEDLDGPGITKSQIEYTALSDTAKKFKGGKPDNGEVTFNLAWDPADTVHTHLLTSAQTAGSTDEFKIVCSDPGATEIAFSGNVSGWKHTFNKENVARIAVTIKLSGPFTVTP